MNALLYSRRLGRAPQDARSMVPAVPFVELILDYGNRFKLDSCADDFVETGMAHRHAIRGYEGTAFSVRIEINLFRKLCGR
ncbi:hypothetical protein AVMA1855_15110 [Acidovorax sp. SUPP1855]|uniref:hypothetical protein n=1 Tax=Acidovorax sp. SUPP1855 TaxID=431774 RepID=UPI0023DE5297|nr:hypothetical protein [Acidovorax sp. SUPP1855]GKS85496.1 hypothetical protein AVMA1855_15110 [Acidovorax sp. SUPP1855]